LTAPPRVLIRTLPLEDGNYGGILQAYALQHVLTDLGASAVTDLSRVDAEPGWKSLARQFAVSLRMAPTSWRERVRHDQAGRELARFVLKRLSVTRVFEMKPTERRAFLRDFDIFLVGSDQVWRRRYADVPSYMLDFVPTRTGILASYAASFGTETLEGYDSVLRRRASELLSRFDAVSVRESSAVDLCAQELGIDAVWHLDPTLLLDRADYSVVSNGERETTSSILASYVLDSSTAISMAIERVAEKVDAVVDTLAHSSMSNRILSVEQWLASISTSDFVVTDSFHGTVFAIVHRVPFVTIINADRGRARFDSLLGSLGLEARLIEADTVSPSVLEAHLRTPIAWTAVESRLAEERARSRTYLSDLISKAMRHEPGAP
jgi:hypothetical protein